MQDIRINTRALRLTILMMLLFFTRFVFAQDGELDDSFGEGGLVKTNLPVTDELCADAVVDADGFITIAGSAIQGGVRKALIARLNPDATPDVLFNETGCEVLSDDGEIEESQVNAIALQSDGKIVAGGYVTFLGDTYGVLYRCNQNGGLDTTFGNSGIAKFFSSYDQNYAQVKDIAVQEDGKIVFCGIEHSENTGFIDQFVTGRCLPDGTPDSSFGGAGLVYCYFDWISGSAATIQVQTDGKILVGGRTNSDFALIRYLPNGVPDNTFGEWGEVTTDIGYDDFITDLGILSDGKIIAVGYSKLPSSGNCYYKTRTSIACYNVDGSLYDGFSNDGKLEMFFNYCRDEAYSVLIQPDDKIIIGGGTGKQNNSDSYNYYFLRLHKDGTRDYDFNSDGYLESDMYENNYYDSYAKALLFQPSGKAVLVGYTDHWSISDSFISAIRVTTGVDSVALAQMNVYNQSSSDSTFSVWFSANLLYVKNVSTESIRLTICNISGSKLYTFQAESGMSNYSLRNLPKGMYFVTGEDGKNVIAQKFIVSYA
ncbi:MAG TPA: T9SS type A sorting domain-containing protein, partial [Cyclobacteriaceae bacterium]|nr:T9SS type A sorting domain-containing protein [Cyclobacteriaceae bacterium]